MDSQRSQKVAPREIKIRQVGNGYWVLMADVVPSPEPVYVFQTFAELTGWLAGHFTHRNSNVVSDANPSLLCPVCHEPPERCIQKMQSEHAPGSIIGLAPGQEPHTVTIKTLGQDLKVHTLDCPCPECEGPRSRHRRYIEASQGELGVRCTCKFCTTPTTKAK